MTHKNQRKLHEGKALAGAAMGAATGYFSKGKKGAATGAVLGGLVGLFGGETGLESL